jgi:hypothetical protein
VIWLAIGVMKCGGCILKKLRLLDVKNKKKERIWCRHLKINSKRRMQLYIYAIKKNVVFVCVVFWVRFNGWQFNVQMVVWYFFLSVLWCCMQCSPGNMWHYLELLLWLITLQYNNAIASWGYCQFENLLISIDHLILIIINFICIAVL